MRLESPPLMVTARQASALGEHPSLGESGSVAARAPRARVARLQPPTATIWLALKTAVSRWSAFNSRTRVLGGEAIWFVIDDADDEPLSPR